MKLTIYVNVYSGSSTCGSEICVVLHVMSLNSVYYTCTVMTCWCGYLSGARCRLLAYGPADATVLSQNPIVFCLILIQTGFTFLVLAYAGYPGK